MFVIFGKYLEKRQRMKKRLLLVLLAVLMLATLFGACGDSNDPAESTPAPTADSTTSAPDSQPSETTPAETDDPFDLSQSSTWTDEQWLAYEQQLDFDGRTFMLSVDRNDRTPFLEDGQVKEDAVGQEQFEVWTQLEEDLNIHIEYMDSVGDSTQALTWTVSGDNPADFYEIKTHTWFPIYAAGGLVALNSEEILSAGLDVNNEKLLYQPFTHAWDINGDTYGVRYASKFLPPEAGWVMFFNKDLVKSVGVDDLYQVVRDGDWTWDYFLELAGKLTKDNDGDGQNDTWGLATGYLGYGEEVLLAGGKIVDWVDGRLTSLIDSTEALETYEFLDKVANSGYLCENQEGANATYKEGHLMFKDGQVGLLWSEMNRAVRGRTGSTDLALAEIEWGTIPTPKADKDADYMNVLGGVKYDVMLVTNKDKATSAAIYAAFARRQNDTDIATCLKQYLQDDDDTDSLDMMENYIFSSPVANWSWCSVDHNDTYRAEVVYKIFDEELSPASIVESAKPRLQALLDALNR